jgi:tetratricopeptide (TPR) repeat protein
LGADNALTLTRAAHAISVLGNDVDGGAVLAERALKLNPLLDDAWYVSGWTMLIAGKPKLAHERLLRARQLSAHDHLIFKIDAASAYALFFTGRYDDATDAAMSALRTRPNYLTAFRIAAASDVLAGRTEQGRRFVAKMRAVDPKLRLSGLPEILPFLRPLGGRAAGRRLARLARLAAQPSLCHVGVAREAGKRLLGELAHGRRAGMSACGTNETKEPRRINSAYRGKADSIQTSPFSRLMTHKRHGQPYIAAAQN